MVSTERGPWEWAEEMGRPAPGWMADHFRSVAGDIEGPMHLNVIVGRCASWHRPGLLLLGDAAHPMAPIRAQGINLALRDVIVAANHLVPIMKDKGGPGAPGSTSSATCASAPPK